MKWKQQKDKLIPKGTENLETKRELKILPSRSCCFLRLKKTRCLAVVPCGVCVCVTWGLRVLETWRLNSGHWGPKVHFTHSGFQASTLFSFQFCEMLEFFHNGNHHSIPCQCARLTLVTSEVLVLAYASFQSTPGFSSLESSVWMSTCGHPHNNVVLFSYSVTETAISSAVCIYRRQGQLMINKLYKVYFNLPMGNLKSSDVPQGDLEVQMYTPLI